jgi:hypothetical protein
MCLAVVMPAIPFPMIMIGGWDTIKNIYSKVMYLNDLKKSVI